MRFLLMAGLLGLSLLSGCARTALRNDQPANWGKVVYLGVGDAYGIIMDDGTRLLPVNLDIKFQADSLPVLFDYTLLEGDSRGQWGQPVRILRMQME